MQATTSCDTQGAEIYLRPFLSCSGMKTILPPRRIAGFQMAEMCIWDNMIAKGLSFVAKGHAVR